MSEEDTDSDGMGVAVPVAVAVIIAIVMALFTGVGVVRKNAALAKAAPAASAVALVASEPASAALPASTDAARIEVVDGVVRFYFAPGKAEVASGAKEALADAVAAAKAGKKLVLSGYHDSTGSAALNAELAKKRAFAVRDALLAEGVAEGSLELKKPEAMPNTHGSDPEARRVDVVIVD